MGREGKETVNTRKPTRQPPSRAQPPTGPFSLPTTHPIQITKQKRRVKRNIFIDIAVVGLRFSVLGSRYSVLGFRAMSNAHWISVSSSSSNHWLKPPTPPTPLTTTLAYPIPAAAADPPPPPPPQMSGTCECWVYVPYIKGLWAKRLCVWQQQAFKGFFHILHTHKLAHPLTHIRTHTYV